MTGGVRVARSGDQHQLLAAKHFTAGEMVVIEQPILHVAAGRYREGTYVWDLVDALLSKPDLLLSFNRLKLHRTPQLQAPDDVEAENRLVKRHGRSRQLVRQLFETVATNNIGMPMGPRQIVAYGLFPTLSRSNHSCDPSCELQAGSLPQREVLLRAKRDLASGDEVTWSYVQDSAFLAFDLHTRILALYDSYRFICRCQRCLAERTLGESDADLANRLDREITEMARQIHVSATQSVPNADGR